LRSRSRGAEGTRSKNRNRRGQKLLQGQRAKKRHSPKKKVTGRRVVVSEGKVPSPGSKNRGKAFKKEGSLNFIFCEDQTDYCGKRGGGRSVFLEGIKSGKRGFHSPIGRWIREAEKYFRCVGGGGSKRGKNLNSGL